MCFIPTDAVHLSGKHQGFVVRGIAGEKYGHAILMDHDGDMISGMTGRRDSDNISGIGQSPAARKRAIRLRCKVERQPRRIRELSLNETEILYQGSIKRG
jgi:hypothetical protein